MEARFGLLLGFIVVKFDNFRVQIQNLKVKDLNGSKVWIALFRFIAAEVRSYWQLQLKLLLCFQPSICHIDSFSLCFVFNLFKTNNLKTFGHRFAIASFFCSMAIFYLKIIGAKLFLRFIPSSILTPERRLTPLGRHCNSEFKQKHPDTQKLNLYKCTT